MDQKPAIRPAMALQKIIQMAPRFQAMNRSRDIALGGEFQLRDKNILLISDIGIVNPAIEANFADARAGIAIKKLPKRVEPIGRPFFDEPGMQSKGRDDPR